MGLRSWSLLVLSLLGWQVEAAEKLRIVTTFLPAYCIAANVAGEAAEVENLLPGSVSLHDYQLSPGDIRKLGRAGVIVVNGLGMETFLERAFANAAPGMAEKVVRLSDGLDKELIEESGPHHHHEPGHTHEHNPHIWLDPQLAMHAVTNVLRALEARDPDRSVIYRRNAGIYLGRLAALDKELADSLAAVRDFAFVTYHSAFPYFVRRYDLQLAGVVEQVPEVAPSPREMSLLLRVIREKQVKALFAEPGASTRMARQIARDTGITLAELDPLETGVLTPSSYEEGMRRNLSSLLKALRP
jgi:zinc transport system substrate-binding protein